VRHWQHLDTSFGCQPTAELHLPAPPLPLQWNVKKPPPLTELQNPVRVTTLTLSMLLNNNIVIQQRLQCESRSKEGEFIERFIAPYL